MNRLHRKLALICAVVSVGCASATSDNSPAPTSGPGADPVNVTSTVQAIVNGMPLGLPDDQHGIVSLYQFQAVTSKGVEINEWRQACTATLLTNTMVLTARHCFRAPLIDSSTVWGSLNGSFHLFTSRVDAPDHDASVLFTDDPFEIDGSTSGFVRTLQDAEGGQPAMAGGYGFNHASQGSAARSDVCGSGYMGCPEDPLPMLISSHTTFWDAGEIRHELGVATNEQGQNPAEGDSGSALFYELYTKFLFWPVLGVLSSQYRPDSENNPGLWNSQYVPIQELRGFLCDNGFGC
jgi:hypothetical protein